MARLVHYDVRDYLLINRHSVIYMNFTKFTMDPNIGFSLFMIMENCVCID